MVELSVQIRGADQDLYRLLLATAPEVGIPISEIRATPMGVLVPVNLAVRVGLLDQYCTEPEPIKPKRVRKTAAAKEQTEALWDE